MNNPVLSVKHLYKSYGDFSLKDINFELTSGTITGFIGANGAGKSTTINSILNIIKLDKGEVLYNGQPMENAKEYLKEKVGYIQDCTTFYEDVKIYDIYKFVKSIYKNLWDDKLFKYLTKDIFNLNLNKKMKELSKGMRTKFLFSLTLPHHPEILILDEPTSGLDPIIRDEVLDILYKLSKEENTTIFLSSHITEDIENIADRVIYIDNGKIILNMEKDSILKNYKKISISSYGLEDIEKMRKLGVINKDNLLIESKLITKSFKENVKIQNLNLDEVLIYLKEKTNK